MTQRKRIKANETIARQLDERSALLPLLVGVYAHCNLLTRSPLHSSADHSDDETLRVATLCPQLASCCLESSQLSAPSIWLLI